MLIQFHFWLYSFQNHFLLLARIAKSLFAVFRITLEQMYSESLCFSIQTLFTSFCIHFRITFVPPPVSLQSCTALALQYERPPWPDLSAGLGLPGPPEADFRRNSRPTSSAHSRTCSDLLGPARTVGSYRFSWHFEDTKARWRRADAEP